jgi:hypothetical protein
MDGGFGVRFREWAEIIFYYRSRTAQENTYPPIQLVLGFFPWEQSGRCTKLNTQFYLPFSSPQRQISFY